MTKITFHLKDHPEPLHYDQTNPDGILGKEILEHPSLATSTNTGNPQQDTLALMVNETLYDLMTPIPAGGNLRLLTLEDEEILPIYRHTSAHVMAYAIKRLFPEVRLAIGPPIDNGFYYDFDQISLSQEDFKAIESEMKRIIKEKHKNERIACSRAEAEAFFHAEPYKLAIIKDLPADETLTYYRMGDFVDLCRGPHLPDIRPIKGFKLQRLAGAYWRGDSKNTMLTRLYALSFRDQPTLKEYIHNLAEQEKHDHNKVGREMGLFISDELVGQGLPLLTPKGTLVKQLLQNMVEDEEKKRGYMHTLTPLLAKSDLYETSGHWEHYKESMFVIPDGEKELALRPMTCPFHFSLYNSDAHSYRDLPIRYAETSILFRNEASGEMHGLTRVRQFTLSDGHIICRPDQVEAEFKGCLELLLYFLNLLDVKGYHFRLSKWDPAKAGDKFVDNPTMWEQTEGEMRRILESSGHDFVEAVGEAAFYGPKLDVQTRNVYGKEDTLLTVQIDFVQPERFKMTYRDRDDQKQQPVVIHRASFGCYERTLAMLIEQFRGNLPFWLAPEQIAFFPVHEKLAPYTERLIKKFSEAGFRVISASSEESLGKRIRAIRKRRIPYQIILGEKEAATETVSIRTRSGATFSAVGMETFLELCIKMKQAFLTTCLVEETCTPEESPHQDTLKPVS